MCIVDVLLVGGGIMSVILGVLLYQLEFGWSMEMFEWLDVVVEESLNGWNNVGIGYLVLCELNYMFEDLDGNVQIVCVIDINE